MFNSNRTRNFMRNRRYDDPMDDWLRPDDCWWGISYIGQRRPFLIRMPPLYATFYDYDGHSETLEMTTMRIIKTSKNISI